MKDNDIDFIFTILGEVEFHYLGIALLTILIPLVIAILTDLYQKRREQEKDFVKLDLHVILDEVFRFQWLLIYIALIFLPTMFWETFSSRGSHFIEIILSVAGIYFMGKTFYNIYHWNKGYVSKFRFKYLSYLWYLKNQEDMVDVWRSVWQVKKIEPPDNESEYLKIFSLNIDQLLKTDEKLETPLKLLDGFKSFINNRSSLSLVDEIFPKILEWHYRALERETASFNDEKRERIRRAYNKLSSVLSSIIESIEERALKEGEAGLFFSNLKEHSEAHKNEKEYLEQHLLKTFYKIFFENIESLPECETIWVNFPEEWKVRKKWLDENNFMSRLTLKPFLNLAAKRIPTDKKEHDRKLDIVSYSLFPEVEPIVWAKILIFLFAPMTPNNKVKCVIEHPWNFGLTGKPSGGYRLPKKDDETDARKAHEEEVRNTFELATMLFKDTFSKENLEGYYIKDLAALEGKYEKDSKEEFKRAGLLNIFTEMLKFLKDPEKQVT